MTVETKPSGLSWKLTEIMREVGYIPKRGHNERQDYDFAAATDVADKVRAALVKHVVSCVPIDIETVDIRRSPKDTQDVVILRVKFEFTDSESGESKIVVSYGAGADTNDKHVYKALTGALKYLYLMSFSIPTGDDPEAAEEQGTPEGTGGAAPRSDQRALPLATPSDRIRYGQAAAAKGLTNRDQNRAFVALVLQKTPDELTTADIDTLISKLDEPGLVDLAKDVKKAEAVQ